MTQIIDGKEVATEAELLQFANAIRQAGGADPINQLIPSCPSNSEECLIANALNFSCRVGGHPIDVDNEEDPWVMWLPDTLTEAQREAIGKVEGVELNYHLLRLPTIFNAYITLPKHIGNAAEAFDNGTAFHQYRIEHAMDY